MHSLKIYHLAFVLAVLFASFDPGASISAANAPYATATRLWRAAQGQFASWTLSGVSLNSARALQFDPVSAASASDPYPANGYEGHDFYNGGNFRVGQATSPVATTSFPFSEAIASWDADTPAGTWVETLLRVRIGTRWTKWYNMGVWASDDSTVARHSVGGQGDGDGSVAVDTLILDKRKGTVANAYQLQIRLFSTNNARPALRTAAVTISTHPRQPVALQPGNPRLWNTRLNVPACSQMVYPDGGEVWCSPTSTSMVLGYWNADAGPCAPRVRSAVAGVYDWRYDGHGNWPFNAAYAATQGYEGFVARFTSLAQLEPWIAAGVPVVVSLAWDQGELTGASLRTTSGHLTVLVGFDAAGDPIVHDPGAPTNAAVPRTYPRAQYESLWLEHSGGAVYLIYPRGRTVPTI